MPAKAHHVVAFHFPQPFAVVADLGLVSVEDFVNLHKIGLCVRLNFLSRERRTRLRAPRGIANHGGKIADQEDRGVTEFLKMFELAENHRMAEMKIRSRRVHAKINAQFLSRLRGFFELHTQVLGANRLFRAFGQVSELFVKGHQVAFRFQGRVPIDPMPLSGIL